MTHTRPEKNDLPLSPVQQGMYFHHLHKKNRVYVEQMLCDVNGPIEVELVDRCLSKLVEAHECLRTVFVNDGLDGPRQVVLPYRQRPLRYRDLSGLPDPDGAFESHVAEDMERNFDLAVETSRCELVKLGPDRHAFLWSYSHLIADAWTGRLLQDQFCETYRSASERIEQTELPRVPYRLYLDWIERQDERKAGAYWTKYLEGHTCRAGAALPAPDVDVHKVTVTVEWGPSARELLGALARRHRSTVNHILLAAWGAYVLDHFQKAEAIFGCVVSGRMIRLGDVEKMGGLFVNTVPMRVREADTVARTISQIRQHAILSSEFAYMSLSDIMAYGHTTPSSLLTVVNFSIDRVDLDHGQALSLPFHVRNIRFNEQAHYDAYLDVYITERDLKIAIHHDPRRHSFDAAVVQVALMRILEQFNVNVEASLGDVALRVMDSELPACGALDFGAPERRGPSSGTS
ncbi:hypothetical protein HV824_04140 [Myxococcus sp. AM009]|uniref:condensation domain-containing protein n=1 Tax=Myxococcus sp. AM009 TaxID=2745137 RepID=UPI00159574FD|nr:condensation domain-containing protein [Myxococcus sp. AM009]NVI97308.1 hypothetical protein [Myxococcus sp. AM009]